MAHDEDLLVEARKLSDAEADYDDAHSARLVLERTAKANIAIANMRARLAEAERLLRLMLELPYWENYDIKATARKFLEEGEKR